MYLRVQKSHEKGSGSSRTCPLRTAESERQPEQFAYVFGIEPVVAPHDDQLWIPDKDVFEVDDEVL